METISDRSPISEGAAMIEFLEYGFMQRAFIAGILIALPTAMLGLLMVLRQLSLIGDGLAHASFGGIAIGLLLNVNPIAVALGVAGLSSLAIYRLIQGAKAEGDAAIALVLSFGMALAVTIIGYVRGFDTDLFSYLFGSILTVSSTDLWIIAGVTLLSVGFVTSFYRDLLHISFNENLARVQGVRVRRVNAALVILVAMAVVIAIRAVGILLVTALLVIPPLTALQLSDSFRSAMVYSVAISITGMVSGIFLAYSLDLPPSGIIVLVMIGFFLLSILPDELERIR